MEADSNNRLLRSMTKRDRKPKSGSKSKDAIKAGAKGKKEAGEAKVSSKLPGSDLIKTLTSTTAINVIAFGLACFAIVKYGDKMAEYLES